MSYETMVEDNQKIGELLDTEFDFQEFQDDFTKMERDLLLGASTLTTALRNDHEEKQELYQSRYENRSKTLIEGGFVAEENGDFSHEFIDTVLTKDEIQKDSAAEFAAKIESMTSEIFESLKEAAPEIFEEAKKEIPETKAETTSSEDKATEAPKTYGGGWGMGISAKSSGKAPEEITLAETPLTETASVENLSVEVNEIEVNGDAAPEEKTVDEKDKFLFFDVIDLWNKPTDHPSDLDENANRFSEEVLIYSPRERSRFIGYYDLKESEWLFVGANKPLEGWKWRKFNDKSDSFKNE